MTETTNPLTTLQQQRAEALHVGRQVLEETTTASAFARPARSAPMVEELLRVADYVLTGYHVEERDEHPVHVAIFNPSSGFYQEATREGDNVTVRTMDLPTGDGEPVDDEPPAPTVPQQPSGE